MQGEDKAKLFSLLPRERTRRNGPELKYRKFWFNVFKALVWFSGVFWCVVRLVLLFYSELYSVKYPWITNSCVLQKVQTQRIYILSGLKQNLKLQLLQPKLWYPVGLNAVRPESHRTWVILHSFTMKTSPQYVDKTITWYVYLYFSCISKITIFEIDGSSKKISFIFPKPFV